MNCSKFINSFFSHVTQTQADTNEIKETINSIHDVIDPIQQEFESDNDEIVIHERNDYLDDETVKLL